ncbi:hypothetical protein HanRHA438_Chr02g0088781 [Helianthus annuus]|nr:hypothetical protein HanRHA438_Chr02g0088781 [Helianthus annuus]
MIEDEITRTWAKTAKKTELKRESYEENKKTKPGAAVAYGSGRRLRPSLGLLVHRSLVLAHRKSFIDPVAYGRSRRLRL